MTFRVVSSLESHFVPQFEERVDKNTKILYTTALLDIPEVDLHFKTAVWCPRSLGMVAEEASRARNSSLREVYMNNRLSKIANEEEKVDQTIDSELVIKLRGKRPTKSK